MCCQVVSLRNDLFSFPSMPFITINKYPLVARDRKLSQTGLRTKGKMLAAHNSEVQELIVVMGTVVFPPSIHSIHLSDITQIST